MAEQWTQGKLDHPEEEKKLESIQKAVAIDSNNKKINFVPELLGDMDPSIKELSLRSKQLTRLSEELGLCLSNLVLLDVSDNKLETLPLTLQYLFRLKSLIITKNILKALPPTIMEIRYLRVLELSENYIETLPNELGNLKYLETLNLSSNYLTELPASCEKLNHLQTLDLSRNAFKILPSCVTRGMRSLETLDVSCNLYINVAMVPASKKLKRLYIRNAGKNIKFPLWALRGNVPNLQVLDCDGTKFKYFNLPENCQNLKLKILSLDNCGVYDKFVQEITSQTDELESLRLGNSDSMKAGNAFWKMPINNLNHPKLLTEISVRGTGLHSVCQNIGNFINLVKLDLSNNNICWLPDEICLLSKLDVLLIDENDLSLLPENIGRITSLKELKANKNHIATLPRSIRDLKQLSYLDLYDNEFREVPEDINYMESLLGVDIDQNNFGINDLRFRDVQYEALRSTLRKRYPNPGYLRFTGPRYESDTEELSESNSDISSIAYDEQIKTFDANKNGTDVEENWDTSDNSADEFDPNCMTSESSRQPKTPFSYRLSQKFVFCPADLHAKPVRQQILEKILSGEIKDDCEVVEGQFDDA